ncbi:MAG: lysylphosphatidylglycerol synthase transmembrane domain-containing protein [Gemmataceae bacterium]
MSKLVRIVVSLALLGWLASRTDWPQVYATFSQLRLDCWLAALAAFIIIQAISSVRWQILAGALGILRTRRQLMAYYFIGMYFNLVLPTSVGGDVVRVWYLDHRKGQRQRAFLSVLGDRLSGFLALFAIALAASLLSPIGLPGWVHASVWGSAAAVVIGLASLPLINRIPWLVRSDRKLVRKFVDLSGQLTSFLPQTVRPAVMSLSLIVQAGNVLIVWLLGMALGLEVPGSYYWIVVPMVTVITLLPLSLNGMGVREAGMVLFLAPLGVPAGLALSLSFLWFCVCSLAALVVGGGLHVFGRFKAPDAEELAEGETSARQGVAA